MLEVTMFRDGKLAFSSCPQLRKKIAVTIRIYVDSETWIRLSGRVLKSISDVCQGLCHGSSWIMVSVCFISVF